MTSLLISIQKKLKENSSDEARAAHRKFVPGNENIYGVRMPVLNQFAQEFKMGGFALTEELWKAGSKKENNCFTQKRQDSQRRKEFAITGNSLRPFLYNLCDFA